MNQVMVMAWINQFNINRYIRFSLFIIRWFLRLLSIRLIRLVDLLLMNIMSMRISIKIPPSSLANARNADPLFQRG